MDAHTKALKALNKLMAQLDMDNMDAVMKVSKAIRLLESIEG